MTGTHLRATDGRLVSPNSLEGRAILAGDAATLQKIRDGRKALKRDARQEDNWARRGFVSALQGAEDIYPDDKTYSGELAFALRREGDEQDA